MREVTLGKNGTGVSVLEILQLLRDGAPRTMAELGTLSGLARATVYSRVETLLSSGLAHHAGEATSTGGRPSRQIAFNPLAGLVLAIDLGATHATVALADLSGKILTAHTSDIDITLGPEAVLDLVVAECHALITRLSEERDELVRPTRRLVGIGIGIPAPVKHSTGQPISPPIMPGWDQFDIPAYVQRSFEIPILVDNDVNLLVLGEHAARWPDVTDLIFVKVSTGIGAGIISGGALQRGAQGSAGDLGNTQVPRGADSPRPANDERRLEAIASGPAIAADLRKLGVACENMADLIELLRAGHPAAIDATRQAGREVGEVLSTIVDILNPSVIVVGGSIARASEHLLAGIREVVYRRSIPLSSQNLTIAQAHAITTTAVHGASIMVLEHLFSEDQFESTIDRLLRSIGD